MQFLMFNAYMALLREFFSNCHLISKSEVPEIAGLIKGLLTVGFP